MTQGENDPLCAHFLLLDADQALAREGSRTWDGARKQVILMSLWRTCWQQGRSVLDFLSQLLRGTPVALALPRDLPRRLSQRD
jgi:hypothetical protein